MFLKVSMFALALCSVRAEQQYNAEDCDGSQFPDSSEDLDCSELLLFRQGQHPTLGRFIIHASGSNNPVIMDMIMKGAGSWIDISLANEKNKYHVIAADKLGDACVYRKGEATGSMEGMSMKLESDLFDTKHKGVFLHTLNDDVGVFLYQIDLRLGDKHFEGKSITLLKKSPDVIVSSDSMELYRRQAKCEGIEVRELPTDLCDEPTE